MFQAERLALHTQRFVNSAEITGLHGSKKRSKDPNKNSALPPINGINVDTFSDFESYLYEYSSPALTRRTSGGDQ